MGRRCLIRKERTMKNRKVQVKDVEILVFHERESDYISLTNFVLPLLYVLFSGGKAIERDTYARQGARMP
jgi:hypothetical protein